MILYFSGISLISIGHSRSGGERGIQQSSAGIFENSLTEFAPFSAMDIVNCCHEFCFYPTTTFFRSNDNFCCKLQSFRALNWTVTDKYVLLFKFEPKLNKKNTQKATLHFSYWKQVPFSVVNRFVLAWFEVWNYLQALHLFALGARAHFECNWYTKQPPQWIVYRNLVARKGEEVCLWSV